VGEVVEAIYEHGVLRLEKPLNGIPENSRVNITVQIASNTLNRLKDCYGIMPDKDAVEMQQIIESEFEKVDLSEWK
jgi:predicted DNA-binding antitoxin AbrB/MazE fold protein